MDPMTLSNLQTGMTFEGMHVLVEKRSEGITKTGKPYLNLTVRDQKTALNAKIWDYNKESHGDIPEGDVVCISGAVEEYQGSPQLRIYAASESLEDMSKFVKSSRFDVDEMWSKLISITDSFREPLTKFVTEEILLKHGKTIDAFKRAPAAKKIHNAWHGGLLEHIVSLCMIAEPVIHHYQTRYKANISRDKVMFGLIMHDAGKIVEYDFSGANFGFTAVGRLTNHMVLGPAWTFEAANRFPGKESIPNFKLERAHLMHVLAAHHGREEWGSPVKPSTLEALVVHHLDNLDSKVMHALELIESDKPGDTPMFSEQSYFERVSYLKA